MNRTHWFKNTVLTANLLGIVTFFGGCQQDVVHQRSIAELNQKAQAMMQAGDYNGAVARLEAAHDLQPEEPKTTHNLAIAYQMQGNYDKALAMFNELLLKSGIDKAEIQKSIGITAEAKADKLSAEAKGMESDPKADKAKVQQLNQQAEESYALALDSYRQAVGGLKNAADVQKQIAALEARKKKAETAPQP
jgi:tetratricopeptide (TPR) repeat protein